MAFDAEAPKYQGIPEGPLLSVTQVDGSVNIGVDTNVSVEEWPRILMDVIDCVCAAYATSHGIPPDPHRIAILMSLAELT